MSVDLRYFTFSNEQRVSCYGHSRHYARRSGENSCNRLSRIPQESLSLA
jgi:hypothetical protein